MTRINTARTTRQARFVAKCAATFTTLVLLGAVVSAASTANASPSDPNSSATMGAGAVSASAGWGVNYDGWNVEIKNNLETSLVYMGSRSEGVYRAPEVIYPGGTDDTPRGTQFAFGGPNDLVLAYTTGLKEEDGFYRFVHVVRKAPDGVPDVPKDTAYVDCGLMTKQKKKFSAPGCEVLKQQTGGVISVRFDKLW